MSCHELVYWSFCASLWSHGAPVYFVRVRSNSCSSMMLGRVACWRAVRAGFVVSCRVLSTAGRRGGQRQPRRPCRALSMDRIHQVMTFCETATWAHRSSVAHLVSLYSSYAHRTPREGVRSPSGCSGLFGLQMPKSDDIAVVDGQRASRMRGETRKTRRVPRWQL
jgi:hypothetical protein